MSTVTNEEWAETFNLPAMIVREPKPEWLAEVAKLTKERAVFFVEDRSGRLFVVLESGTILMRSDPYWHCVTRKPMAIIGAGPWFGVDRA